MIISGSSEREWCPVYFLKKDYYPDGQTSKINSIVDFKMSSYGSIYAYA